MTIYQINSFSNPYSLMSYLSSKNNYVNSSIVSNTIIHAEFNHNSTQIIEFLKDLAKKTSGFVLIDNVTEVNLSNFAENIQTDKLLFSMTPRLQINNLSGSYVDIFPALYDGFPIPIHTLGYKKMGFVLLWNKNAGTSNHDIRLVKCDNSGNLFPDSNAPDILIEGINIPSGRTTTFDFNIPNTFLNFRGFLKLQARSGNGTDDPILDALFIYLIRS